MISRNGLNHHLNNIEHQAGIFARTASELADNSVQNSKAVILKNFDLLNGVSLSAALEPFDGNFEGPISRPPKNNVAWTAAYQSYHSAGDEAEPFCGECETSLEMEFNFCPECGTKLDWGPER